MHPAYLMFFKARSRAHVAEQYRRNVAADAHARTEKVAWDAEHAGGLVPHGVAGPDAVPDGAPGGELSVGEGEAAL